jgi:hypothetical protein
MTRDDQIELKYHDQMNKLARAIDELFNPKTHSPKLFGKPDKREVGFFLAIYPLGDSGRFNYISNCDRNDVIVLLKEMLARFEGQPEISGSA